MSPLFGGFDAARDDADGHASAPFGGRPRQNRHVRCAACLSPPDTPEPPLSKKLGIKAGALVLAVDPPANLPELLDPLPEGATLASAADEDLAALQTGDPVLVFGTEAAVLAARLGVLREALQPDRAAWVCWPKKASKVETDITEDVIRDLALPLGLVDVKVCAVDATWSGLRLVIRKELR